MSNVKKAYIGPERWMIVLPIVIVLVGAAIFGVRYIVKNYTVTNVSVTGNRHYTGDQIADMVMEGPLGHNSLYLSFKYKNKPMDGVPFVETMDVDIVAPDSIAITVYEKAIAGCVEYLDRYMYFDKDGIIVESSVVRQSDIPYVTGLHFDHVVLYEALPVGDESIFKNILNLTQLMTKYNIETDQIFFDSEGNVRLFFGDAKVDLGSLEHIDEKMIKLKGIIPDLAGLDGTLYMDDYSGDDDYFTFQREDVKQHESVADDSIEPIGEISDETEDDPAEDRDASEAE